MLYRWQNLLVLGLIGLVGVTGCSRSSDNPSTGGNPAKNGPGGEKILRIAVIPKGTTHEFWKSVHAGAANAAKEFGHVEIIWKGPMKEDDREGQISVVTDFVTEKVDGICLAPLDAASLMDSVELALENQIPVVIFDSGLEDHSKIVSYVATNNIAGGAAAARRLGEALAGKGNVILLRYNAGSESTEQREKGFLETLETEFPEINILSSDQYSGVTPEESLQKATDLLNKYRDEVHGLFAVCEPNATGALGALEETELASKVKFIAFDPNDMLIQGLRSDHVHGIVLQNPVNMGYEAVQAMVRHLRGETVEKRIDTGETVATRENMDDPEIHKLLVPEQFGE
jgi:ribose transport system substrate-binding protein